MNKFWEKYSTEIIIGVLLIVAILVIYFVGKSSGKKYTPKDVELPGDTSTGGTEFNPGKYTDIVWNNVEGGAWNHDADTLQTVANLSDSQLVAVYNDWSKRYYEKRGNETMTTALISEYSPLFAWDTIRDGLVARLEKYNAD